MNELDKLVAEIQERAEAHAKEVGEFKAGIAAIVEAFKAGINHQREIERQAGIGEEK